MRTYLTGGRIGWICAVLSPGLIGLIAGCSMPLPESRAAVANYPRSAATSSEQTTSAPASATSKHKAAHGGVLNAIITCENGHAEVKLDRDTLTLWFVNGGSDTDRAVRVSRKSLLLQVHTPDGKESRRLELLAQPLELAGETAVDCSRFEGKAPWLTGMKTFTATGEVNFKGTDCPLRIEYPQGYDPD